MTRISIALLMLTVTGSTLGAQTPMPANVAYDTRAGLEVAARNAEAANHSSEAMLLRSRLQSGDFQEGDRIVVVIEGATTTTEGTPPATSDTMQVRAGKVLQFAGMGEVSLDGVLRSELSDKLRQHLSKYLKNPTVRATPLLPLAVLGSVRNPGYVYAPADYVLRDLIMRAGGPAPDAEVSETVVRRDGKTIWDVKEVRTAFSSGLSLDRLHLHAGDELYVPQHQTRFQLSTVLSIATAAAALAVASMQLRH